jgi:hypothetical protein
MALPTGSESEIVVRSARDLVVETLGKVISRYLVSVNVPKCVLELPVGAKNTKLSGGCNRRWVMACRFISRQQDFYCFEIVGPSIIS